MESDAPLYRLLRDFLFRLDAEQSHRWAFALFRLLSWVPGVSPSVRARTRRRTPDLPVSIMGLRFPNPVGLAAGLDKDARYIDLLAQFGFGWLELGTVTPRAQDGNEPPRLFRLVGSRALINRMGFNNIGMGGFVRNLGRRDKPCLIAVNIGKNHDTPWERAIDDYVAVFRAVHMHAAYVAVNISSPNTPGLRGLQAKQPLDNLLHALKIEQVALAEMHGLYVPITLKIAPDVEPTLLKEIAESLIEHQVDAVIATNTTLTRPGLSTELLAKEAGGLSGAPLKRLSTAVVHQLYRHLQGCIPIIGVGGIETAADAWEKLVAGADLVQIYTGLIYHGPDIVNRIVTGLKERVVACGCTTLAEAVRKARTNANE